MTDKAEKGITLIELLVAIAIVGIISVLVAPEIGRFRSNYNARSCATDLIQYMRVARAMAIKENREYLIVFHMAGNPSAAINPQGRYLIGFDGDGDDDLITVDFDTFGICNDADGDRLPNGDALVNGVPSCVRVVNLAACGNNIIFGYATGITPPTNPPNDLVPPPNSGITFSGTPPTAQFDADGSMDKLGSVYFQQTTRGYSYCVIISNNAGATNMWKWNGDANNLNPPLPAWTEIR